MEQIIRFALHKGVQLTINNANKKTCIHGLHNVRESS
jgi:hypothetical protein